MSIHNNYFAQQEEATGLTSFVHHFGYLAIFILMALESACIPIPSEVVIPYGGYLAGTHALSLWAVIVTGVAANVVGGLVIYYIGRSGGRALVLRYGRFFFLSERHLIHAESWFAKRGEITVFVGRLLPAVRTFVSLPAGMARMPVGKFLLYTLLGSIPWNIALAYTGFYLGKNWSVVDAHLKPLTYFGALVLLLGIIWFWSARKQPKRQNNPQ